jgi:hypothetical protein
MGCNNNHVLFTWKKVVIIPIKFNPQLPIKIRMPQQRVAKA